MTECKRKKKVHPGNFCREWISAAMDNRFNEQRFCLTCAKIRTYGNKEMPY